jgi:hypothetical protein
MSAQHHRLTLRETGAAKPFRADCSCSIGGDFATRGDALDFIGIHMVTVKGINTKEFVDLTASAPVTEQEAADSEAMKEKQESEVAHADSAE